MRRLRAIILMCLALVVWAGGWPLAKAEAETTIDQGCSPNGHVCAESMANMTADAILGFDGNAIPPPSLATTRNPLAIPVIGDSGVRPVVVEQFTAAWCPYCYGSGKALDRLQFNLAPRDDLIVISYHILSDGYTTSVGETRKSFYNIGYVPTCVFNGRTRNTTNCTRYDGEDAINRVVESYANSTVSEQNRTAMDQPFTLRLEGTIGPKNPQFTVYIGAHVGFSQLLTAYFLVTEDRVPVFAGNGLTEFNGLVRGALGSQSFYMYTPGQITIAMSYTGTIPCSNPANLRPVVFIQNQTTKEILGASGEFWVVPTLPEPVAAANPAWMVYE